MKTKIFKILAPLAYIAMVAVNYLANALPIAGRDTGAISDRYPNLFAPAGYAFSIWGLIYTLLAIYVIYQFKKGKDGLVSKVNGLFILTSLFNIWWILTWHNDWIWLSVILMLGLLFSLIKISKIFKNHTFSKKEKWLVRLPFSVYLGWITVATIANITVFLVSINWNGFGLSEIFWKVLILLIGAFIGSMRTIQNRNIPYGLVLVWAYGAILYKHISPAGFDKSYPEIIWTVSFSIVAFLVVLGIVIFKKEKRIS
jgi:hypothetical protein